MTCTLEGAQKMYYKPLCNTIYNNIYNYAEKEDVVSIPQSCM